MVSYYDSLRELSGNCFKSCDNVSYGALGGCFSAGISTFGYEGDSNIINGEKSRRKLNKLVG